MPNSETGKGTRSSLSCPTVKRERDQERENCPTVKRVIAGQRASTTVKRVVERHTGKDTHRCTHLGRQGGVYTVVHT